MSSLKFIKNIDNITYDSVKKVNPEFRGLIKETVITLQNKLNGSMKTIKKDQPYLDKCEFIDDLIKATQELSDICEKLDKANEDLYKQIISLESDNLSLIESVKSIQSKMKNYEDSDNVWMEVSSMNINENDSNWVRFDNEKIL